MTSLFTGLLNYGRYNNHKKLFPCKVLVFKTQKYFLWCDSESIPTPGKLKDMSVHGGNQISILPLDYHPNAVPTEPHGVILSLYLHKGSSKIYRTTVEVTSTTLGMLIRALRSDYILYKDTIENKVSTCYASLL